MTKLNGKSLSAMLMAVVLLASAMFGAPQIALAQVDDTPTPPVDATETPIATETDFPIETPTEIVETETPEMTPTAVEETATPVGTPTVIAPTQTPTRQAGTLQGLLDYLHAFNLDPDTITPENTTAFDRMFLEGALAMNTSELQMMDLAVQRARNSEVRRLARMMLEMHEKDQALLLQLVENAGGNTNPSLSRVALLPGTAEQSLGFNWVDLNVVFGNKVKSASSDSFDLTFLDVAIGAHAMIVDAGQVARFNSTNPGIQALGQHLAQEAALHKMLMTVTRDRIFFGKHTPITFPVAPTIAPTPTPDGPSETETVAPTEVMPTIPPIEDIDPAQEGLTP